MKKQYCKGDDVFCMFIICLSMNTVLWFGNIVAAFAVFICAIMWLAIMVQIEIIGLQQKLIDDLMEDGKEQP